MELSLYVIHFQGRRDDWIEGESVVVAESGNEAFELARTANPGYEHDPDVEAILPVKIDQTTPKGVVHFNLIHTS